MEKGGQERFSSFVCCFKVKKKTTECLFPYLFLSGDAPGKRRIDHSGKKSIEEWWYEERG